MAKHQSLDIASRAGSASDADGRWVPIAGRTGASYTWTVTVDAPYFASGASVTVRVEAAGRMSADDVVTLHTFGALVSPAQQSTTVTLSGYLDYGYLRTVANVNGTATMGTVEEARFFSITAESGRISARVAKASEVDEYARQAEADLLAPYRNPYGYDLAMYRPQFVEDMREAIARQIVHRFELGALSKSTNSAAIKTAREMEAVDRQAKRLVGAYSSHATAAF